MHPSPARATRTESTTLTKSTLPRSLPTATCNSHRAARCRKILICRPAICPKLAQSTHHRPSRTKDMCSEVGSTRCHPRRACPSTHSTSHRGTRARILHRTLIPQIVCILETVVIRLWTHGSYLRQFRWSGVSGIGVHCGRLF